MTGYTHTIAAITLTGLTMDANITTISVATLASLTPDLDNPNSFLARRIPILPAIINFIAGGHRQGTHSFLALIILSTSIYVQNPILGKAWFIGYGSHLLLDILTPYGIPLFYPFQKRISFPITITGGLVENLFLGFLLFFNVTTIEGKALWADVVSSIKPLIPFL